MILSSFRTNELSDCNSSNFLVSNYQALSIIPENLRLQIVNSLYNIIHKDKLIMKSALNSFTRDCLQAELDETVYEDYEDFDF
jgi:hypothetical protein